MIGLSVRRLCCAVYGEVVDKSFLHADHQVLIDAVNASQKRFTASLPLYRSLTPCLNAGCVYGRQSKIGTRQVAVSPPVLVIRLAIVQQALV